MSSELDKRGLSEFFVGNMKCLAIHGSKEDAYWKSVAPGDLKGDYSEYDIVFSGHSHISHCFNFFYPTENPKRRNKKAVLFINPGSVGQPRNHNPKAQYAVLDMDTLSVSMRAVTYDINGAMSMFDGSVDDFYRERLEYGV